MFENLFESRDKTITYLIKLGDCLGRSLRENVSLFNVDANHNQANYLTASGKVITGNFVFGKDIELTNLVVQEASVFNEGEVFDSFVQERIGALVEGIYYNEYAKAEDAFDEVLSLWKNRLKLNTLQNKLSEKTEKLSLIEGIIDTEEFQKLLEVTPQLKAFLESKFDKIKNIAEIRNAVNLSNTVSQAFNFPRLTYDELVEGKSYKLVNGADDSIYEMICRQELVKKELLESKKDFETIWATNEKVINLASSIYGSDEEVAEALFEALKEVPYLALVSKKVLSETINSCIARADGIGLDESDIAAHASRIFEIKKEAKKLFINTINEKYGVDVQNLKEPPTFKSLVNTQIVIFESLARVAPKGSVLKQVLGGVANMLKTKSGVEAIDVNDYVFELFSESGYGDILVEATATKAPKGVNLKRLVKNIGDAQDLLGNIKQRVKTSVAQMDSEESLDGEALETEGGEMGDEMPAEAPAPKGKKPMQKGAPKALAGEETPEEEALEGGALPPEAGVPSKKEMAVAQETNGVTAPNPQDQRRTLDDVTDLENMLADLAAEIGIPDDASMVPDEEVEGQKAKTSKNKNQPVNKKKAKEPHKEVD